MRGRKGAVVVRYSTSGPASRVPPIVPDCRRYRAGIAGPEPGSEESIQRDESRTNINLIDCRMCVNPQNRHVTSDVGSKGSLF